MFLVILYRSHSPHQKVVAKKSSFCTHCDDGDDDACNPQQQHQPFSTKFLSFSLSSTILFLLLSLSYLPHNPVVNAFHLFSLRYDNHTPLQLKKQLARSSLKGMEKRCGCWGVLTRTVSGVCKSSVSRDSPNTIPRTSLVYDSGINHFLSHIWFCICIYGFYLGCLLPNFEFLAWNLVSMPYSAQFAPVSWTVFDGFIYTFITLFLHLVFSLWHIKVVWFTDILKWVSTIHPLSFWFLTKSCKVFYSLAC